MITTSLGSKSASRLGYGCFALTGGYGRVDPGDAFRTLHAVLDSGVRILDTSDAYAAGANEDLVGRAVADRRESVVIVTKFGWVLDASGQAVRRDSSRAHVRNACEASLRRLRTDYIDVYLQHRVDPDTPIEETVAELSRLQQAGLIRSFGLCEVSVSTLERAQAVAPLAALQTEYSLWSREPELELIPACVRLGLTFMAYSPLGRGFLTGRIRSSGQLGADDFRHTHPRFEEENLQRNLAAVDRLSQIARARGCTSSQLALAWLLCQKEDVVPIPSTRSIEHFEENLKALDIRLTSADLAEIAEVIPAGRVHGERHPTEHMRTINL